VKSEIKKVLVDLRETMNSAENPFAYLDQFREMAAEGGVDKKRLKKLEDAVHQLKELGVGEGAGTGTGTEIEEERIKKLEDAMEELKILDRMDAEKLEKLEAAIEMLAETGLPPEKPVVDEPAAAASASESALESESELNGIGAGFGPGLGPGIGIGIEKGYRTGMIDTVTLAQLMQWADSALNLIGMEKLNQIVELYELTGRISGEMKDTILKIAELPDAASTSASAISTDPEKEHVEAKHCIISLLDLNRILTGEHQELLVLLKDLCPGGTKEEQQ
jgi:archaellum component FlaD/FlaE